MQRKPHVDDVVKDFSAPIMVCPHLGVLSSTSEIEVLLFSCSDLGYMYWAPYCSVQINSFLCAVGAQKPTGAIAKPSPAPLPKSSEPVKSSEPLKKTAPPKVMDINAKQVCKHKGCGNTFTEKQNHEAACSYHPGPAVFHDRQKGVCCFIHCDSLSNVKNRVFSKA